MVMSMGMRRLLSLAMAIMMAVTLLPANVVFAENSTTQVCTGLIDCAADTHSEDCEKASADMIAKQINALPSLEAIKAKPIEEQQEDYNRVQSAYDSYCTLSTEQQAMLPPAEEVFRPYFDYFNSLIEEASTIASGSAGAVKWTLDSSGKLRVYGNGDMGVYSTDMGVNAAPWREYAGNITTVVIESGVTAVGRGAFLNCPNIVAVTIPTSVKIIGERAFYKCGKLSNVTIPTGVTTVGEYAFAETGLASITIPETINTAVKGMFFDCTKLTTVTFKGAVTDIGEKAFSSCDLLTNINFEKGLSGEIAPSAFAYCTSITEFDIPEGVLKIKENAFSGCSSLASVTLPEGLESVWVGAFSGTALTSVTIPQSVEYMEATVFTNCNSLQNVTMYTSTVEGMTGVLGGGSALEYVHIIGDAPQTDKKVFYKYNENFVIYYDEGTSGWVPPTWQDYLIEIWGQDDNTKTGSCGENLTWILKNGILTISGTGLMDDFQQGKAPWYIYEHQISKVVIEDGVASVGDYAFWEMENLTDISIAGTVKVIGQWSFFECTGLTKVDVPDGTVAIEDHAFRWCTGLTAVTMADSVTTLGNGLFTECRNLKSIKLSKNISELSDGLFSNCQRLEEVWLPDGVTVIGRSVFSGCFGLKHLELPQGITTIESNAFSNNGLTEITLPAGVESLGAFAFSDCKSLKRIRFQGNAPAFDVDPFRNVTATCTYPANNATWTADVMKDYGGTITWSVECTGEAHIYDQSVANEQYLKSEATCTAAAVYYKSCVCGEKGEETFSFGEKKEHNMSQWTPISEATPEADGEERRDCADCDHFETRPVAYTGNLLKLEGEDLLSQSTVWINGMPYSVKGEGDNRYVELPTEEACLMVTYAYHMGDADDVHTHYPTGMKVYKVSDGTITHIPELDNLLQYSGSSIRITGNKGIRMITSLYQDTKTALMGKGLAGYTLLEYGTALCWGSEIATGDALVLGKSFTRSNYAYKKGVADPVFATSGNLTQYTNVLVGFTNDQCKDDIAMRPYIILQDAAGEQVTIYGGTIYRSIGYIAYQNRNAFKTSSAAYDYVWSIIHHVYGDQYDADYKG